MCWCECVLVHCFLPYTLLLFHVTGPVCEMGSNFFSSLLFSGILLYLRFMLGPRGHAECCHPGTESSESCGEPDCETLVIFPRAAEPSRYLTSIRLRLSGISELDALIQGFFKLQSVDLAHSPSRDTLSLLILCLCLCLYLFSLPSFSSSSLPRAEG